MRMIGTEFELYLRSCVGDSLNIYAKGKGGMLSHFTSSQIVNNFFVNDTLKIILYSSPNC